MPQENPSSRFGKLSSCAGKGGVPLLRDAPGELGTRNIDRDQLRCYLLNTKRPDIGGNQTILDIENWVDCRVYYVPTPNELINQALTAIGYGQLSTTQGGSFFDQLAADLEDSGQSKDAAPLISLLNMVSSLARQDTLERAAFEEQRRLAAKVVLPGVANIIKSYYPASMGVADTVLNIILMTIDISVATADYISEYMAARREAARRLYSTKRRDRIMDAYRSVYGLPAGSNISSATVAAWCRAGNIEAKVADSAYAYLSAPDGTDGEAEAAQAQLDAARAVSRTAAGWLQSRFGGDWRRAVAMNAIFGAWVVAYNKNDVHPDAWDDKNHPDGYPGWGNNSIMRYIGVSANEGKEGFDLWQNAGEGDLNLPRNGIVFIGTVPVKVLDSTAKTKPKLAKVWWQNYAMNSSTEGGWNFDRRRSVLGEAAALMWAAYPARLKDFDWFGAKGKELNPPQPKLTTGFAADIWEVWKFWKLYIGRAFPYMGKVRRWEELRKLFMGRIDGLISAAKNPALPLEGANTAEMWERRAVWLTTGNTSLATTTAKKGKARPCPDGGTGCLPCDIIKTRLPIGAVSFPIPMMIEYSGSYPRKSTEFNAWAANLASKGYPGYYIDCLAREVTFKSKATGKTSKGEQAATTTLTATEARNQYVAEKATYTKSLYDGLSGVVGLTAPRMAELRGGFPAPTPPILLPELAGINRPLGIEILRRR